MIKMLLQELQSLLENTTYPEFNLEIIKKTAELLEAEQANLSRSLASSEGNVDYYSPNAAAQLIKKADVLKESIETLTLIQATILCVRDYEKQKLAALTPDDAAKAQKAMDALTHITTSVRLLQRTDIRKKITLIKDIEGHRQDIKKIDKELLATSVSRLKKEELTLRKTDLLAQVKIFDDEVTPLPGYKRLEIRKGNLQVRLDKHKKLAEKIPEGMVDVKKALYLLVARKQAENTIEKHEKKLLTMTGGSDKAALENTVKELKSSLAFSDSADEDANIVAMLTELRLLMKNSVSGYRDIAIKGGELNGFLQDTTAFYWENLYLYRETLSAVNGYLKGATNLSDKGKFIARCVDEALNDMPPKESIVTALAKVDKVDTSLSARAKVYETPKKRATDTGFYQLIATSFIEDLFKKNSGSFFYIPYNSTVYTLDHPAHQDFSDALGNCYGESSMFLQRINGVNPTFNNICPERDLLNFQLDQTRNIAGQQEKFELGAVKKDKDVDLTKSDNNVKWDDIKDILLKEVDSKKNGDLCLIKLGDATVAGHATSVGHVLGLIKMKNPSPYKYVVYDYNFGAVGLTSDEQLKLYVDNLLDHYCAFYSFKLEKQGELSDAGASFISGIGALNAPAPAGDYARANNWNQERLTLLAKYGDKEGLLRVLTAVKKLPTDEQLAVYGALKSNKNLPSLLNTVRVQDMLMVSELLKNEVVLPSKALLEKFKADLAFNQEVLRQHPQALEFVHPDLLPRMFTSGAISATDACRQFKGNFDIVKAAYQFDSSSITYADKKIVKELFAKGVIKVAGMTDILLKYGEQDADLKALLATKEFKALDDGYKWVVCKAFVAQDAMQSLSAGIQSDVETLNGSRKKFKSVFGARPVSEVNATIKSLLTKIHQLETLKPYKNTIDQLQLAHGDAVTNLYTGLILQNKSEYALKTGDFALSEAGARLGKEQWDKLIVAHQTLGDDVFLTATALITSDSWEKADRYLLQQANQLAYKNANYDMAIIKTCFQDAVKLNDKELVKIILSAVSLSDSLELLKLVIPADAKKKIEARVLAAAQVEVMPVTSESIPVEQASARVEILPVSSEGIPMEQASAQVEVLPVGNESILVEQVDTASDLIIEDDLVQPPPLDESMISLMGEPEPEAMDMAAAENIVLEKLAVEVVMRGLDKTAETNARSLYLDSQDWTVANRYLLLLELSTPEMAQEYFENHQACASAQTLAQLKASCEQRLAEITAVAQTPDYGDGMKAAIASCAAVENAADNYLGLAVLKTKLDADFVALSSSEHNPASGQLLPELHANCLQLLKNIESKSLGATDEVSKTYCAQMAARIEKGGVCALVTIQNELQNTYKAVASPQMEDIKLQIKRLENKDARGWFQSEKGTEEKIVKIKAAVCAVPMMDRQALFTDNKQVRDALATNRGVVSRAHLKNGEIDESRAAKSFTDLSKKFKNDHKEITKAEKNERPVSSLSPLK